MKKLLIISAVTAFIYACSGNTEKKETTENPNAVGDLFKEDSASKALDAKGIGKFTNVELGPALDSKMAGIGSGVYDLKCSSCHKLTDERLVGPGWKDVTVRRKPEWIMNFATNVDEMLDKDPEAQAMLEICLVRMPNQNLSDEDARSVLEFMRKNDGVK
ncbi:MAG TPA: c-type cytochrome [Bacteroidia bacterium]|nr:c-type cytochrome [Bacteroidia bacterium]